ncbi:heterokaryon incompatibility protein-domain-containing protein [Aspergillus pseudotamarii]|uniref:Heterokaryon incompatibility protein-domain-containing protein n=1 Tax=Aspergillus pseudotamarii TaxID=132259 RepID=A0A5N6SRV0_ASPPS|nr:heterokaryon incompatibility protein-domain-containing protein [Aspergillus pseudotamarii]KAE8137315.1 heterokaryon incompatibility protein-domain-containing protein [Aspergillus pseudotamarii]
MAYDGSTFVHTALPTNAHYIRLLKFEDTAATEPLRFTLGVYKFSDEPVYNALSYEWGIGTADRTIFINDCPFLIRDSLYDFLGALAGSKQKDILFFADAICINQDNIPERNAQVQRMGDLYRQAQKVLVWLGPGTADSDLIFDICAVGNQKTIDLQGSSGNALDMLYRRSYWTRLWVIQELFLARDAIVFCGSKSTPWSSFRRLTTAVKGDIVLGEHTGVDTQLGSSPMGLHTRRMLSNLNRKDRGDSILNKRIDNIMFEFGKAQCRDVRDRVYGLLGLAKTQENGRGLRVMPDYSATTVNIFVQLLSNMPYTLGLEHALRIFNILKLHHVPDCTWDVGIPDRICNLIFEVGLTHLGHIRHVSKSHPLLCDWCKLWNKRDNYTTFELDEHLRQELRDKVISELMVGKIQSQLSAHNCGPLLALGPYDCCVTAGKLNEGDAMFLMEGTKIVLIENKPNPEDESHEPVAGFTRGVLANTKDEGSILQAAILLDRCLPSLPAPREVRLEKARFERPAYPFEVIHEELTLQQIMLILTQAARHSSYYD